MHTCVWEPRDHGITFLVFHPKETAKGTVRFLMFLAVIFTEEKNLLESS